MSLIAKERAASVASGSGSPAARDFKLPPAGTHLAVCTTVVDLGVQETIFQGKTARKHQVFLRWELVNERTELTKKDGTVVDAPVCLGRKYTLSLHPKAALRADLEAWRGRAFTEQELMGFDLAVVAGMPCQLMIVHVESNGRTYANVRGVSGWPRGMPKPERPLSPILTHSEGDADSYNALPEFLRKLIGP
jgi:hypothetical protein